MSLIKKSTFTPSLPFLFDDFFTKDAFNWGSNNYTSTNSTLPSVNIIEQHDGFVVEMAAPGMEKRDFHIELNNETLVISSNKEMTNGLGEGERYSLREFSYQTFKRTFQLSKAVIDDSKIEASYKNGILRVLIPKKEEVRTLPPRMIQIK